MSTPPYYFQSRPGHSPQQYTVPGTWPNSIYSNPTTPDATSEPTLFSFDQAPMQNDNPGGNFYHHSKSNSDGGSSYSDTMLNSSLLSSPYLRSDNGLGATQALPISHHHTHTRRQSHATTQPPPSMVVLSEPSHGQYTGHQLNQPVPPHLLSSSQHSNASSFGHSQMFGNTPSFFHTTYGTTGLGLMQLNTAGQFNTSGGGLHGAFQPNSDSQMYGQFTQETLRFALQQSPNQATRSRHVPFSGNNSLDPQTLQALFSASIQQYSRDQPSPSVSDGSPLMNNSTGYTHLGENMPRAAATTAGNFNAGGSYIEPISHGWQHHSRSLTSTPSLVDASPHLSRSPSLTHGSISTSTLAPPSLFSNPVAEEGSLSPPPAASSPSSSKSNKRTTKKKSVSSPNSSSHRSQSTVVSVSPAPIASSSIPLHIRVAQLPDKKRRMFEQACGDRWNKSLNDDNNETDKANLLVLEAFYALIGSPELAKQLEIPDELVKALLAIELLPKDGGKKGSRGGAAGYKCLWAGCNKELIKRQDHARNHVREHCGSKPHACGGAGVKGCGQRFLRMDDLKRHQKAHCSVLRSGPGRRPRSIRGVHHDYSDEEDDHYSEESLSTHGGDEDEFRLPSHELASVTATRERASRLRARKALITRDISSESSTDGDEEDEEVAGFARHQTSNIRGASLQNTSQDEGGARMLMQEGDNGSALV